MWGVGCVFFEMVSLVPPVPGNQRAGPDPEDPQRHRHAAARALGEDEAAVATTALRRASRKRRRRIEKLIPHIGRTTRVISSSRRLLAYDPDDADRLSARQACGTRTSARSARQRSGGAPGAAPGKRPRRFGAGRGGGRRRENGLARGNTPRGKGARNKEQGLRNPRAPAPSVASTGTTGMSDARRRRERRTRGAPSVASSKDSQAVSGPGPAATSRAMLRARRRPRTPARWRRRTPRHHRDAHARAHAYERGAYAASSVSGASVLSAGGHPRWASALGWGRGRGARFCARRRGAPLAAVGSGRAMRGGVVGKPLRRRRPATTRAAQRHHGARDAGTGAAPLAGWRRNRSAPFQTPPPHEAREKYVSPCGQR